MFPWISQFVPSIGESINQSHHNKATMFKSVFIIFGLLFLVFVSAENLEIQSSLSTDVSKSFTATCDGSNVCMYSVVLSSINVTVTYSSKVSVIVGGVEELAVIVTVDYANPAIINFEVTDKAPINVLFDMGYADGDGKYTLIQIFNKADGRGNLILDSKSLQILLQNTCPGQGCTLLFGRSTNGWPNTLAALFKINGTTTATLNAINSTANVLFNEGDILTVELDGITTNLPDNLIVFASSQYSGFSWFLNVYYTPMVFPGVCAPSPIPIPSPFGGPLIPVTQEEIDAFLAAIGTSFSTLWYRETENLN